MATPAALESRLELCIKNERGNRRRRMKSYKKKLGRMFEDQGGQNKTEQSRKGRNVYFGVITDLLEERTTSHLPRSFRRSPPWIQLHLHTSRLFIISPFSPGLLLLRLCFTVSSLPLCHLSPSLAVILQLSLSPSLPSFILSFF